MLGPSPTPVVLSRGTVSVLRSSSSEDVLSLDSCLGVSLSLDLHSGVCLSESLVGLAKEAVPPGSDGQEMASEEKNGDEEDLGSHCVFVL